MIACHCKYPLLEGVDYCVCNNERKEEYLNMSTYVKYLAGFRKPADFKGVIQYFKRLYFGLKAKTPM